MAYVLLGLAALALVLLILHGFVRANVTVLARQVRFVAGLAALAGAGVLVFRGLTPYALPLAMVGSWLLWGTGLGGGRGQSGPSKGQISRVATDHLEMELDHQTGTMRGQVLKGVFAGRDIESMAP